MYDKYLSNRDRVAHTGLTVDQRVASSIQLAHTEIDHEIMSTVIHLSPGTQWLSGRVLVSRPRGRGFEPHPHHCVVSMSKNINPSLVRVQPRKTRSFITERLLMGCKESNQTKQNSPLSL